MYSRKQDEYIIKSRLAFDFIIHFSISDRQHIFKFTSFTDQILRMFVITLP